MSKSTVTVMHCCVIAYRSLTLSHSLEIYLLKQGEALLYGDDGDDDLTRGGRDKGNVRDRDLSL